MRYLSQGNSPPEARISLAGILLMISFYLLTFSNLAGFGPELQITSIAILFVIAVMTLFSGKLRPLPPTPFELCAIAVGALSAAVGVFSGVEYSGYYTLTFIAVILFVSVIIRHFTPFQILGYFANAHLLACITVSVMYWRALPALLNPLSANRWSLRFMPFDMHPNLVGFVYGIGAIALIIGAIRSRGAIRVLKAFFAAVSFMFVLTASARASILAGLASTAVVVLLAWPGLDRRTKSMAKLAVLIGGTLAIFAWERVYQYLKIMLELNSQTRGFSSGGTGRFELWSRGVGYIASSGEQNLFGSGLRTSYDVTGFSVESSYINIITESGIALGCLLLISIVANVIMLATKIRTEPSGRINWENLSVIWIILFALTQSIFNRYLLAIGNGASLLLIALYSAASITGNKRSVVHAVQALVSRTHAPK